MVSLPAFLSSSAQANFERPATAGHQPVSQGIPVPEAYLLLDHGQYVLSASPGVALLLGLVKEPSAGDALTEICDDAALLAVVGDGGMGPYLSRTTLRRTSNGKERHLLVHVLKTPFTSGTLLLIVDLTQQVLNEDELMLTRAAQDAESDPILLIDAATWQVHRANASAQVFLGFDSAAVPDLCVERLCQRIRSENGETLVPAMLATARHYPAEYVYVRDDGRTVPVELQVDPLPLAHRKVLVVTLRDISERVQAAEELRSASSRCGITFNQAATGLAHVSLDGRWDKVNPRMAAITGYSEAELLGMQVEELTHPLDRTGDAIARQRLLDGELTYYRREKRYIRKDASHVWVSLTSSLARANNGAPLYFIGMIEDITERKLADERIRRLATRDVMTDLPNRLGLQEHLELALEAARLEQRQVGVVFVDMDKLKQINDTHGHEQGDRALIALARQLQQQVRSGDMVARIGGDEFVLVLGDVDSAEDIRTILTRTLSALARPADEPDGAASSCSMGISMFPADGQDGLTLIRNADLAMYRAKQRGGASYEFYSGESSGSPNATTTIPPLSKET